jgi:hypothetical protein
VLEAKKYFFEMIICSVVWAAQARCGAGIPCIEDSLRVPGSDGLCAQCHGVAVTPPACGATASQRRRGGWRR